MSVSPKNWRVQIGSLKVIKDPIFLLRIYENDTKINENALKVNIQKLTVRLTLSYTEFNKQLFRLPRRGQSTRVYIVHRVLAGRAYLCPPSFIFQHFGNTSNSFEISYQYFVRLVADNPPWRFGSGVLFLLKIEDPFPPSRRKIAEVATEDMGKIHAEIRRMFTFLPKNRKESKNQTTKN